MFRFLSRFVGPAGLIVLMAGLVLAARSPAHAGNGAINAAAPPETRQFAFILGEWECKTRFLQPDRTYAEGRATWTGRVILDGWAIQDDWVSTQADGTKFHGTNIRSFNPKTEKWDNRWLAQGSLQWKYFESEMQGESMVMTGGAGRDLVGQFIDRNTFHDITPNGWKWRKDRSYDNGESWVEGIGFIEATRGGASASGILDRVEHGYAENDGVKIHFAALGEGPLVVLIHGYPDYWYTWRHQMAELARDHRVVAIDLRGYNRSDKPEGVDSYAMRHLIGDVVAVIRKAGAEKATVVGHDWGGGIAWMVATYVPQVVDRLIVLSTPHPWNLRRELATNSEQRANSDYARRFQEEDAHTELDAESLASWVEDAEARKLYVEAFERSSFAGMLNYYKANYPRTPADGSSSADAPAAAIPPPPGNVQCPVLVIHGLEDKALMPSGFNETWRWVDGELTIVSLPGVGHFVQHEAQDRVTQSIAEWLRR